MNAKQVSAYGGGHYGLAQQPGAKGHDLRPVELVSGRQQPVAVAGRHAFGDGPHETPGREIVTGDRGAGQHHPLALPHRAQNQPPGETRAFRRVVDAAEAGRRQEGGPVRPAPRRWGVLIVQEGRSGEAPVRADPRAAYREYLLVAELFGDGDRVSAYASNVKLKVPIMCSWS